MIERLKSAKQSFYQFSGLPHEHRRQALKTLGELIDSRTEFLITENSKDLAEQKGRIAESLYQRLKLDKGKILQISQGVKDLIQMPDPLNHIFWKRELDQGLILSKISVPLGVLAVIFESRPDVIPQLLSLALKTGNVVLLKGGAEALHSNRAFMQIVAEMTARHEFLPKAWAQLMETRAEVSELIGQPDYVDLVIPRGSNQMVRTIMENSLVPVLGHAEGICHVFVEASADPDESVAIIRDAKVQYPSACNSMETLLVQNTQWPKLLPLLKKIVKEDHLQVFGCEDTRKLWPEVEAVSGWSVEYGDLRFAIKTVNGLDEAIAHINQYGSHHTDVILSKDQAAIEHFMSAVDSASVFANASPRFADGFRYGFGAEVGVSTSRLHARGPVGMEGLITYKYQLRGKGQVVADYVGEKAKKFTHKDLL
jgi:glutamate-5-semialdehyde dehydrogenase